MDETLSRLYNRAPDHGIRLRLLSAVLLIMKDAGDAWKADKRRAACCTSLQHGHFDRTDSIDVRWSCMNRFWTYILCVF